MGGCLSYCVRFILGIESSYEEIPDRDDYDRDRRIEVTASRNNVSPKQRTNQDYKRNEQSGKGNIPYQAEFFKKYDLKEVIGVGSTGTCHRCRRKSDSKEYACKIIDKRQIEAKFTGLLDQFYTEIRVLKDLKHPNVIQLEDVFETADRIFIVMEVMNGGELFDYVVEKGTLSEAEASVIVRKITSAVAHMHSKSIIHRDLKPENLLLTEKGPNSEVKLIDFGLAKIMSDSVAHSFLGTRGYLAPEMLQRNSYNKAIDIWALGIIVFVLLCGCLPFDDDSSRITSEVVIRKKFTLRFPRWSNNLSGPAKDLLTKLLDVDPNTRITAEEALAHPWVSGVSVAPNNYLQSPNMLGGRQRREGRSPRTPQMQEMHKKLLEADNECAKANAKATKSKKETGTRSKNYDFGQAGYDSDHQVQTRKNSL